MRRSSGAVPVRVFGTTLRVTKLKGFVSNVTVSCEYARWIFTDTIVGRFTLGNKWGTMQAMAALGFLAAWLGPGVCWSDGDPVVVPQAMEPAS